MTIGSTLAALFDDEMVVIVIGVLAVELHDEQTAAAMVIVSASEIFILNMVPPGSAA